MGWISAVFIAIGYNTNIEIPMYKLIITGVILLFLIVVPIVIYIATEKTN